MTIYELGIGGWNLPDYTIRLVYNMEFDSLAYVWWHNEIDGWSTEVHLYDDFL